MDKLSSIVNTLDRIASEIEPQDEKIALAIDVVSDQIEKKAYFNQSTWLPGRSTRDYPFPHITKKQRTAVYVCPSCSIRREMITRMRCPKCGHFMHKA